MKVSQNGVDFVKHWERFVGTAYQDIVGVWTIGYGETDGVHEGMTISEPEAAAKLEARLNDFAAKIQELVKVPLTQNQLDALTAFAYNVGIHAFAGSTLLKKLNAGDTQGAADQFCRWDKAGGEVVKGLLHRRLAELQLFLTK